MFYYTYVLKSKKDGEFYVGYTEKLEERIEQHNRGKVASTKERQPLELVYYEVCKNKLDATHRERYLKRYYGKLFLKNRIKYFLKE